jgi:DNA-repair protein XRCC3
MDGIYIERISTRIDLIQRLQRVEPLLQHGQGKRRVKLLVIDSVANTYRDLQDGMGAAATGGGGAGELTERSEALFRLSGILRKYADEYQIAVVVTNQAVDCISSNSSISTSSTQQLHQHLTAGLQLHSKGRQVAPALGLAWANCVNTRVFLSRDSDSNYVVEGGQPVRRRMMIVFSPYLPQWECEYVVEHGGVRGVAGVG